MNRLDTRILALIEELGPRFRSDDAYRHIIANVSPGAMIEDKARLLIERTRKLLKGAKDDQGRRRFENVPRLSEDGNLSHEWGQPHLFDSSEWNATIDQCVRIAESVGRKANRLTERANEQVGLGRQLPFPWLVDGAAACE